MLEIVQAKLAEEKITLHHNIQLKQQKQQRLTLLTELNKDLQKMLTLRAEVGEQRLFCLSCRFSLISQ